MHELEVEITIYAYNEISGTSLCVCKSEKDGSVTVMQFLTLT